MWAIAHRSDCVTAGKPYREHIVDYVTAGACGLQTATKSYSGGTLDWPAGTMRPQTHQQPQEQPQEHSPV